MGYLAESMWHTSRKRKNHSEGRASGAETEAGRAMGPEGKALSHIGIFSGLEI